MPAPRCAPHSEVVEVTTTIGCRDVPDRITREALGDRSAGLGHALGLRAAVSMDRTDAGRPRVHRDTRDVLVAQLAISLERGHWRVAIRRFLMLSACGFDMPDGYRTACEALVLSRSEGDLRRIRHGVQSWVDMLLLPRRAPREGGRAAAAMRRGPWSALIASVMDQGQSASTLP